MDDILFLEIAAAIVTAGLLAFIARILRQPLIIAYIITGLLVGPGLFGFAQLYEVFDTLAKIGIAFLLFLVGLHLNWRNIKEVGKISLLVGLGQIIFTSLAGFFVAQWIGFDWLTSVIIGVAFSFSSTIIIVKILSDKDDIDRFYGRISVGILIIQDIVAIFILLFLSSFGADSLSYTQMIGFSVIKMILVLAALLVVAKYILPNVFRFAAKNPELLFLLALSWCFALASGLTFIGFGIETGALLAGISLAGTGFQREIESKIRPLRDFFLVIFFIVLGTNLIISDIRGMLIPVVTFSVFVLIGNPIIVILLLRLFGYHPRTGFLVGITMAQISEFSFILLASAASLELIDNSVLPLTTMIALITIAISSYLIKYNEQIYDKFAWTMRWLESAPEKPLASHKNTPPIFLFGFHHLGKSILPAIKKFGDSYCIVDFDPMVIDELELLGEPHIFGDVGEWEFLDFLKVVRAKLVICSIPDMSVAQDIIEYLKIRHSGATIIVTAKSAKDAKKMYDLGATFVIVPSILAGELFSELLNSKKFKKSSWKLLVNKQKKMLAI